MNSSESLDSLLTRNAWVLECESPLEISHAESGSFASGMAARLVIDALRSQGAPLEAYAGPSAPAPPPVAWPLDPALFEPFLDSGRTVTFTAVIPLATLLSGEMHDYLLEAFEHPSMEVELRNVKSRVLEGSSEPDCADAAHEGDVTLQIIATLALPRP